MQDQPHFATQVTKDYDDKHSWSHDSSKPVPPISFEPADNRLPTQEGKQTSQKSVSTSKRHLWEMPTDLEDLKLEHTESHAGTEFCLAEFQLDKYRIVLICFCFFNQSVC